MTWRSCICFSLGSTIYITRRKNYRLLFFVGFTPFVMSWIKLRHFEKCMLFTQVLWVLYLRNKLTEFFQTSRPVRHWHKLLLIRFGSTRPNSWCWCVLQLAIFRDSYILWYGISINNCFFRNFNVTNLLCFFNRERC